jgi:hypothetical protein
MNLRTILVGFLISSSVAEQVKARRRHTDDRGLHADPRDSSQIPLSYRDAVQNALRFFRTYNVHAG